MKTYAKDFIRFNRKNEVGFGLALIAFAFTVVFGSFAIFFAMTGMKIDLYPAFTFPTVFWILAIVHFVARSIVMKRYM